MLPLPLAILGELILLWRVSLQMRLQAFMPSSNWRRSVTIFVGHTWCDWPQRRDGHAEDDGNQQEPVTIVCVQVDEVRHSLGSRLTNEETLVVEKSDLAQTNHRSSTHLYRAQHPLADQVWESMTVTAGIVHPWTRRKVATMALRNIQSNPLRSTGFQIQMLGKAMKRERL
jgi:hypothetical protein